MTQVWFAGMSWCPRHERSMLLLHDKAGRPTLGIQVPLSHRELVLDEIARARNGCCSAQRLLLCLLKSFHLTIEAIVFEEVNGAAGARVRLAGNPAQTLSTDDPVAAAILGISMDVPMYANWPAGPMLMSPVKEGEESGSSGLPDAISRFLQDSEAMDGIGGRDEPAAN